MKKYLTELIGTFFLCLTISGAVASGSVIAPIAIGASLMVMVYMGGHISGGHYNPAVSLAVFMRGKLPASDFVPYIISQIVGAVLAGIVSLIIFGKVIAPSPAADARFIGILLAEILYTFALALVVLNVATAKETEGKGFYGLAIGFTVLAGAVSVGGYSGGAFNPAVGLGLNIASALTGNLHPMNFIYYSVGPFAGGALAAVVYRIQHGESQLGGRGDGG